MYKKLDQIHEGHIFSVKTGNIASKHINKTKNM